MTYGITLTIQLAALIAQIVMLVKTVIERERAEKYYLAATIALLKNITEDEE